MGIFQFLIRTRLKNVFKRNTGIWMSLGGASAALFAVVYGLLLGYLVLKTPDNPASRQEVVLILVGGLVSMIAFGVIKDFLPSYKRRPNLIPPTTPVSIFQRWAINQASAMMNLFVVAFLLFACSFAIVTWSTLDGPIWFSLFLAVILIAELCSYVIRTLFEYSVRLPKLFFGLTIALMAAMVYMFYQYYATMSLWMPWAILAGWLGLSLIVDINIKELRTASVVQRDIMNADQAIMRMVFRNDVVRRMLVLALVFKIVMAFILFEGLEQMFTTRLVSSQILFWQYLLLLLSPVLIFSYVFGNAWAFFSDVFFNLQRIRPIRFNLFGTYLQLVSVPLAIDLSLVLLGIAIMGLNWADAMGLVVMSHVLCVAVGFLGSLILPKKVDENMTWRKSQIHTGVSNALFVVLVVFTTGFAYEATRWWSFFGSLVLSLSLILLGIRLSERYVPKLTRGIM